MAMQSHVKPQGSPGTQGGKGGRWGGGGNLVKILSVGGGGGGIYGFPVKILFMKCKVNTCQNQISCEVGGWGEERSGEQPLFKHVYML
jgi:hypothetical protein